MSKATIELDENKELKIIEKVDINNIAILNFKKQYRKLYKS